MSYAWMPGHVRDGCGTGLFRDSLGTSSRVVWEELRKDLGQVQDVVKEGQGRSVGNSIAVSGEYSEGARRPPDKIRSGELSLTIIVTTARAVTTVTMAAIYH